MFFNLNFSFFVRYMWRAEGAGEVYAYFPEDDGYGRILGPRTWYFEKGVWQKITQRVRLSTAGQVDGVIQVR